MQSFVKSHEEFVDYVKTLVRFLRDFLVEVRDRYEFYRNDIPSWVEEIIVRDYPDLLEVKNQVISTVLSGFERILYEFPKYESIIYVIPIWKLLVINENYVTNYMVLPFIIPIHPHAVIDPCQFMALASDIDHLLLYVTPLEQVYSKRFQLCDLLQSISFATYFAIHIEDACEDYMRTGEPLDVPLQDYVYSAYVNKDIFFKILLRLMNLRLEEPSSTDVNTVTELVKQEITLDEIFKQVYECFPEEVPTEVIRECLRKEIIIPNHGFSIAEII